MGSGANSRWDDAKFAVVFWAWCVGLALPVVVGSTLAMCSWLDPTFRPSVALWIWLALPAALYYLLEWFVESRQFFNCVYVWQVLTVVEAVAVVAACVVHRPKILVVGAAVSGLLTLAMWRMVPASKPPRMF
jgi:hypothetical protein